MAAVWNSTSGKQLKSNEKVDRELRRLRFDVKQYDAQLKKLQRELALKNNELKKLKSCGACTCLGDRRRSKKQTAEVQDLGTFGPSAPREIGENVRLEIHGRRPASATPAGKNVENVRPESLPSSLRRSKTDFIQNGVTKGGADTRSTEQQKRLEGLHEDLAQLRTSKLAFTASAHKDEQIRRKEDENARTLRELGRQVRELENELLKLRDERYRLLAESEQLHGEINSKETNLLRCESQLTKAEREKTELAETVRQLEHKERQLTAELNKYKNRVGTTAELPGGQGVGMQRWSSDLALAAGVDSDLSRKPSERRPGRSNRDGSIERARDCNPYCEVCRVYRSKLVKHSDQNLGVLNGVPGTSKSSTSPLRNELEQDRLQLDGLKTKQTSSAGVTSVFKDQARQRELEMVVDELEKQKRLMQRYLAEIQSYERTVAEKDKEIGRLKISIRDLERNQECLKRKLSDQGLSVSQLQRDLAASTASTQKMERNRITVSEEYKQLEEDYKKLAHDKITMQREWELCIEEQDKQNRLLQRYSNENQTYERLLADKDREISKLKASIRDLEKDYDGFRKNLVEQESNLLRLQRDLSNANATKEKTEQGRVVLADDYKRLQQQYQALHQDKSAIQRELELCVEEQEKQKRLLQRYLTDIQSYERLLAEKEQERMDILLRFQASCKCGNSPPRT